MGSIGRPHIARAITSAGGTANVLDAYAKYINNKSEVYVERKTVAPHDAVEIIAEAGGIPAKVTVTPRVPRPRVTPVSPYQFPHLQTPPSRHQTSQRTAGSRRSRLDVYSFLRRTLVII